MQNTRYYYNILNEDEKKIYKAIYDGILHYKNQVKVPDVSLSDQRVAYVYKAVLWDNPFFFSVGEHAMQKAVSQDKQSISITRLCDENTEKLYREKVQRVVNKILNIPGLKEMSDFQKEVFVHDFIINNVEYDHTLGDGGKRLEPYTVYGVFVEKKAVCEGIAKAVKLLLNLLDVKCIIVDGTVDGERHSWNIVKLKDFSYNLDVTFDMGKVSNNGHMRYDYFNFRDADDTRRVLDNEHRMPKCSAIEYNYVIKAGGFVSNKERLILYMENCLNKHKPCMYIKINNNVSGEFDNLTKDQFLNVIGEALYEAQKKAGIKVQAMIDDCGIMGITSLEITYI